MERLKLIRWLFCGGLITMLFLPAPNSYSQTVKRQSISCYGTSQSTGANIYSQTAGQAFSTQTYGKINVRQGFQQPISFKIEKVANNLTNELVIDIFPNPAKYHLTLRSREKLYNTTVSVTNVNGNIIFHQELTNVIQYQLNCSSWAAGIYFIKVTDGNNKQSINKLIISK